MHGVRGRRARASSSTSAEASAVLRLVGSIGGERYRSGGARERVLVDLDPEARARRAR